MITKTASCCALIAFGVATGSAQTAETNHSEITYGTNILKVSEAQQVAFIRSTLDQCIPPDLGGALTMLVLNRRSLTLHLIEERIEAVLRAPKSLVCPAGRQIDAPVFINLAVSTMIYVGNTEALKQLSKLMLLDEQRFGAYVGLTLINAEDFQNPFSVAYGGFDLGNPALAGKIAEWQDSQLANAKTEFRVSQLKHWWAEAMVTRYGGVPSEA